MYNKLVTRNPVSRALQLFFLFFLFFLEGGGGELGDRGIGSLAFIRGWASIKFQY